MSTLSQRLINEFETNCGVSYHTDCIFSPKHKNRFEEKIVEIADVLIYRNIHIFHTQQHIGTRQFSDSGTYGHICC